MRHWRSKEPYTAQEASWWRVFDPVSRLLFDLYHCLRNKDLSRFVPLTHELCSICASFQWTGSTPARFFKLSCGSRQKEPYFLTKKPYAWRQEHCGKSPSWHCFEPAHPIWENRSTVPYTVTKKPYVWRREPCRKIPVWHSFEIANHVLHTLY